MSINLSDKLTADHSENYIMSIRLRSGGLSFSAYNPSVNESFFYRDIEFDRTKPYVSSLKECFFENDFLTWFYKQVNVVCATSRYTLVPAAVFQEKQRAELLAFTFSSPEGRCLDNELKDEQAELVFGMDEEVYEFCARSLVNPRFVHHVSPLLSLWKKQSRTRLHRQLYVVLHRRGMDVACYAQGNLLFVNSFEYEHTDDILYYILYVWKQVGMDQQKDQLLLSGDAGLQNSITNTLRNYLRNIDPQEIPSEAYLMGSEMLQAPLDLIALSLCEL